MSKLRARTEHAFERFARTIYRHRIKTLLLLAAVFAALVSQLPKIAFDTSTESFFRKDDPALIAYDAFREQFGRDEMILVAVVPPDVFDAAFLARLREFHRAIEAEVPHLKEVTSLINARNTRGEGDELIVEDLIETIPQTPAAMAALRERVLNSELYPNLFVSPDGRLTTVLIETQAYSATDAPADLLASFGTGALPGAAGGGDAGGAPDAPPPAREVLSDAENSAIIHALEAVAARFSAPDFQVRVSGSPLVTDFLKRAMQSNMGRFIALALLAIGVFLGVLFRRVTGVVLPLLVVLLSLVSTVGVMAVSGVAFKLPLMILPSFLLAVGVGASVHLLAMFYRSHDAGQSKADAIAAALGHSGLPILMASLTTAAGLASFATAALASVADLGVFASIGVLISLVYTLALVPALLALLPLRQRPPSRGRAPWSDRVLTALGRLATRRAGWVTALSALLLVVAALGLPRLQFSHNTLRWFPADTSIRRNTDLLDRALGGTLSVEVIVDTGRENGLYEPAVMRGLDALAAYAEAYEDDAGRRFVGKTNSVSDVLKEINRALNENRQAFYAVPDDRSLIAQELLLFENSGSDDLERVVDSRFAKARLSIRTPWDDAAAYVSFVRDLEAEGQRIFGAQARVRVTGLIRLLTESIFRLMHSMVTSYSIAISVITVLMILLIGRLGLGLLSMIPNLAPIVFTLGFMGWAGIPLDAFTLLIGSIALGLAVDDTIHFFHNFRRYHETSGDLDDAVQQTLLSTGRALLFTTLVLVTGFWLFMFASLNNLFYFGLLTGLALLLALLADLLLAPAMLKLLLGRRA